MFDTFLRAQQTSPTLVLAHNKLGDEGALELAGFLAASQHLRHLDLSGNSIGSTGALHLARALKAGHGLESLVLGRNCLLRDSEAGFVALCRALHHNVCLRHLDLKHCGLQGDVVSRCLGELLQANTHLSHLELSSNRLGSTGGQLILDHLSMNTTLLDCQLSGCQVPPDILVQIAELLRRNRLAQGADLEPGPFRGSWCVPSECKHMSRGLGDNPQSPLKSTGPRPATPSNTQTEDYVNRLLTWRAARRQQTPGDGSYERSQQLIESLERLQAEVDKEREGGDDVQARTKLLIQGFKDREDRFRRDVLTVQRELLDYTDEHRSIRDSLEGSAEQLRLFCGARDEAKRSLSDDVKRYEAEEARAKNDLVTEAEERKRLEGVLRELEEKASRQELENMRLRERVVGLRAGVDVLDSS